MPALNLVLIGLFELEHGELLGAPLLDDFTGHGCFAGIGPQQNLLVVRMDGQDGAKIDLFPYFANDPLDADGVARRDAILLSPSLNDRCTPSFRLGESSIASRRATPSASSGSLAK